MKVNIENKYLTYIYRTVTLPPDVTIRKIIKIAERQLSDRIERYQARRLEKGITDQDLVSALDGRYPDIQTFLDHMVVRRAPTFFVTPRNSQKIIETLQDLSPCVKEITISAAERACNHIFDPFSAGQVDLGEQIDWHSDFKSGHHWNPKTYYGDLMPAPYPGGYDIKVPWELSRCQHFVWMGQAYMFTRDEKYPKEFANQVLEWIESNPPLLGVNWSSTMDVALRVVSWLWGYYYFKESRSLANDFYMLFFKSLLLHGRYIFNHLEWSESLTSNHYLSNLVGLLFLGILLPEFKEAQQWREFALTEIENEMFKQVYEDGVDFEASISYHRLVVEFFTSAVLLAQLNGYEFSTPFLNRLEKMLEFIMYITRPDGSVPLIGDNDNGRLFRLKVWEDPHREWNDHRYLLAIGAVLFDRIDFAEAAGDQWEEAFWLLGEKAIKVFQSGNMKSKYIKRSRSFPKSGIYIMRDKDTHITIDAGSAGQNGNGGHAHNDIFSFEFHALGRNWIVDPGTYVYTSDYAARNKFRSTAYHNTVMVDSSEQNQLDPRIPFSMVEDASIRILLWESHERTDHLVAEHTGYKRLPDPVIHRREFIFDKPQKSLTVHDQLICAESHIMRAYLHFHPEIEVQLCSPKHIRLYSKDNKIVTIKIYIEDSQKFTSEVTPSVVSFGFGQYEESHCLRLSFTSKSMKILISPDD